MCMQNLAGYRTIITVHTIGIYPKIYMQWFMIVIIVHTKFQIKIFHIEEVINDFVKAELWTLAC